MLRGFTDAWLIEVGARLRAIRLAAKLPPADVAAELGVSVKTIYAWEAGTREIGIRSLGKLCLLYGVEPGYVLFETSMVPDDLRAVLVRAGTAAPSSVAPARPPPDKAGPG